MCQKIRYSYAICNHDMSGVQTCQDLSKCKGIIGYKSEIIESHCPTCWKAIRRHFQTDDVDPTRGIQQELEVEAEDEGDPNQSQDLRG